MQTLQWLFQRSKPLITLCLSISGVWDYIFFPLSISFISPTKLQKGKLSNTSDWIAPVRLRRGLHDERLNLLSSPVPPCQRRRYSSEAKGFPLFCPGQNWYAISWPAFVRRRKKNLCRRMLCADRWVEWPAVLMYWRHVQCIAQGCQNKIHSGPNISIIFPIKQWIFSYSPKQDLLQNWIWNKQSYTTCYALLCYTV